GGFKDVYKGFTNANSNPVVIKCLNPSSQQGVLEFRTEIELLTNLRHQNLVSLIEYCEDKKEMIHVYDYMLHGDLRDRLYNTNNPPLQWDQRLKMCIGVAQELHYLHRGPNHTIVHRDVKTTNILINEKWIAKKITKKSDVYSFGVVLCEVLCTRALMDRTAKDHMRISLTEWTQHCYNNGTLDQLTLKLQGSEMNGNDENHANDSSTVDYHVLFSSGESV
ncbi:hypothetical protein Goshw_017046, partial [Gossypium schwendimanii]|nr:hypothetical protein [Gossypium schwendimanii]